MKAVWNGSISWGLVNIPIKIYSAVKSSRSDFRQLCREHKSPIYYKRFCEKGGEEVGWDDIVNGLEFAKDSYFVLTREEIEKLKPKGKEDLEIIEFVGRGELKPIYYNKSYFVAPYEKNGKAYFLFKDLLDEMEVIAIGKFVMRDREYLCALQPFDEGMLLSTLYYHQDIRNMGEIEGLGRKPEFTEDEIEMGKLLIEKYYKKAFQLEEFSDTFIEKLKELIRRKMEGEEVVVREEPIREEKGLLEALKASVEREYQPMLCENGMDSVLDSEGYIFEPKMDGTRCIAEIFDEVRLFNRRGRDITRRYPEIARELSEIEQSCVLDGEIVCYNEENVPDFNLLQKREQIDSDIMIEGRAKMIPATYEIFDILEKDGEELLEKPLSVRKEILGETVKESEHIKKIIYVEEGRKLWDEIRKKGMEGVVAKKAESGYITGKRRWHWVKIKNLKTIDVVIVGYTSDERGIGSLGMALFEEGDLIYIGNVGTGFTLDLIKRLKGKLEDLKIKIKIKIGQPPVANPEKAPKEMKWVRPHLVGEVKYLEMTDSGELRAPSFKGLKDDKPVKECGLDQLWKGRIEECIEIFNREEKQSVRPYEHEKLCEDYLVELPTLLGGRGNIPYSWVKAKLEAYRRG
jgi:Ku protein